MKFPSLHRLPASLSALMPGIGMVRDYRREWLQKDLASGMVVFAVTVPTSLAYAELAGVAPVVGLYTSLISMLVYFLLGTSRQLLVCAEAAVSVLVATSAAKLAVGASPERYLAIVGAMAMLSGAFCLIAGLLRFGFIADFMPKQAITGFMNGVALVVIACQAGKLFGIRLNQEDFFPRMAELVHKLPNVHLPTLALAGVCLAVLLLMKWKKSKVPGPVVVVILSTAASAIWDFKGYSIKVVGDIPEGLPHIGVPNVSLDDLRMLWPGAISVALVSYADTILTGRAFAAKNRYTVNADKELIALGAANTLVGLFGGFPVGTSKSRTSVNDSIGGKTQLVGLIASLLVGLFLLFFTSLLKSLPLVALASVITVAGLGLIEIKAIGRFFRIRVEGGIGAILTTLGVLALGVLHGILLALGFAVLAVLYRLARPTEHIMADHLSGLLIYRFDGPLFFLNSSHVGAKIRDAILKASTPPRIVLIDAGMIINIDLTAAEMIEKLHEDLQRQGIVLSIASTCQQVSRILDKSGVAGKIGSANFYDSLPDAEKAFMASGLQQTNVTK